MVKKKIADVSSSLHTIMAVHEEKLIRQEEALDGQETEFKENIQELHSEYPTTQTRRKHMKDMETKMLTNYRRLV